MGVTKNRAIREYEAKSFLFKLFVNKEKWVAKRETQIIKEIFESLLLGKKYP